MLFFTYLETLEHTWKQWGAAKKPLKTTVVLKTASKMTYKLLLSLLSFTVNKMGYLLDTGSKVSVDDSVDVMKECIL